MTAPATSRLSAELVTAGAVLVLGLGYGAQAIREGVGTLAESGAGLFPLLVAVALVGSAAVVVAQELRSSGVGAQPSVDDDGGALEDADVHWPRVAAVLVTALAVPFAAGAVGFVTTLSIAMAVIARIMGMRGWRAAALGAGFGVLTWWVFVYWLVVPLPAGVLGLG